MKVAHEHVINGSLTQPATKKKIANHKISIARQKKDKSSQTMTIYSEVLRFLEIWSKNN